ncbi:hypothetical protein LR48_Vigan115s000200 [Vigna angularis]|uniref:Uncharacterized protein n=1 Tax=Phaseolus angularis TaxID=3914 RepID=A0A0L9T4M8_PHAAN|nr:hypothetical protein LR48_Vigan115s000200 [Vigna angularis]
MESEKNSKSAKEEKPQVPLSANLPLSGTQEHPLAPLRGEGAVEGRIDYALVPLSGSLPLSGGIVSLAGDEENTHLSTPWRKILDAKATFSSF